METAHRNEVTMYGLEVSSLPEPGRRRGEREDDRDGDREGKRRRQTNSYERDRERDHDRNRDRERDRDRVRDRDRDRGDREKEKERDKERDGDRRRDDKGYDRRRDDRTRDRDRERERERPRERERDRRDRGRSPSPSPPPNRYGVVPLHKRVRRISYWDVVPAGYEHMTAEQAKATGHFPLPCHLAVARLGHGGPPSSSAYGGMGDKYATHRQQPNYPSYPNSSQVLSFKPPQGAAGPAAQNATVTRQSKRLYIGNILDDTTESMLVEFFNDALSTHIYGGERNSCVMAVSMHGDKSFAFVEFRDQDEATKTMSLDGIMFRGQTLKIRRPKDYTPTDNFIPPPVPGVISTQVVDSANKIFVGGLPSYLNEDQITELLKAFGELRAFNLVKDPITGQSKGYAFCEFVDPAVTDLACTGLNNMEINDKRLVVQRAATGAKAQNDPSVTMPAFTGTGGTSDVSRVVLLLNMVNPDDIRQERAYEEFKNDIQEECSQYGRIQDVTIPRPEMSGVPQIAMAFVMFENIDDAQKAFSSVAGRSYAGRTVIASYFPESRLQNKEF